MSEASISPAATTFVVLPSIGERLRSVVTDGTRTFAGGAGSAAKPVSS